MKVKNCYCFVDTNTFLHYRFFMEIDWCREIGADHVILVVCSTVLSELDDKKLTGADSKIRDRAKKVISKLAEIADVNRRIQIRPIRPNVELQFLPKEPNIDWESEGLDPRVRDDRIIAKILCERASKNNIVLVAADFGLK
jgi:predicted ribonuclease YlaK